MRGMIIATILAIVFTFSAAPIGEAIIASTGWIILAVISIILSKWIETENSSLY